MPRRLASRFLSKASLIAALFLLACGGARQSDDLYTDTPGTDPDAGDAGGPPSAGAGGGGAASEGGRGGAASTGGRQSGGSTTGGASRGGSGGVAAGGVGTGGVETGGVGTGGIGTGGRATGGVSNGGSSGAGAAGGTTSVSPLERVVPFQTWNGPGDRVTGILFTFSSTEFGPALNWGRGIAASTPPQPYWFGSDGSSPYALYFPSSGEGVNFLADWQVKLANGDIARYDAAMFTPETNNPWGLVNDAHIVTLEVNDGRGSNGGLHFVATDVEILDGTDDVPMDLVPVMRAALVDFESAVERDEAAIEAELESARQNTSPPSDITFDRTQAQGLWPTWRTQNDWLELTFVHRRDESWRAPLPVLPDMAGAAPIPMPPPPRPSYLVTHYHVEYLVTYRIDVHGATIGTETFGPTAVSDPSTTVVQ